MNFAGFQARDCVEDRRRRKLASRIEQLLEVAMRTVHYNVSAGCSCTVKVGLSEHYSAAYINKAPHITENVNISVLDYDLGYAKIAFGRYARAERKKSDTSKFVSYKF